MKRDETSQAEGVARGQKSCAEGVMRSAALSSSSMPSVQNPSPSVRDCLRAMATPIQFLKGVGPRRAEQLESLGLKTVEDLLYHLPFRYEDRRHIKKITAAEVGEETSFVGRMADLQKRYIPRRRSHMLVGILQDDTATIDLIWYRAPAFLIAGLAKGQTLWVHGKVEQGLHGRLRLVHPTFEVIDSEESSQLRRIVPVYVHPAGLSLTLMRKWAMQAFGEYHRKIPSRLPPDICARHGLMMNVADALAHLHAPPLEADLGALNEASSAAHKTIIFD
jgi:ATP-dependent DNA helicase RecG